MKKCSTKFSAAKKLLRSQEAHKRLANFYSRANMTMMKYHQDVYEIQAFHERVLSKSERRALYNNYFKKTRFSNG